jgi:hypothetical protein
MKKLAVYILLCGWLFALLDWKVIQYTRLKNREWLDWIHAHEKTYALVTRTVEHVICTPAMALKPIFHDVLMSVEAAKEEQESITHATRPSWKGFYHLTDRRYSWTFVSWLHWLLYWLPLSILWHRFVWRRFGSRI